MRLVSLCPSTTELVFDLGAGDALVGRTKFCVHPAPDVAAVEPVGGTKNPKVARIAALAPDLVLMNEEENRREDAEALAAAGVRVHASFPRDAAGTATMVRDVGAALADLAAREGDAPRAAHIADAAARIAADIDARSARARAEAAARAAAGEPPVRWAYLIWRRPWMAAGADTFVDALLTQAGGVNVFAGADARYPTVTEGALAAAAPDVVLLATEPFPFDDRHAGELAELTGLPADRFVIADGELLSWHGSRTPHGVDYAARLVREAASRRQAMVAGA
jgi:ABC-type Fe3+-hydroxamate transport system substrate-binding protein